MTEKMKTYSFELLVHSLQILSNVFSSVTVQTIIIPTNEFVWCELVLHISRYIVNDGTVFNKKKKQQKNCTHLKTEAE